MTRQPPPPAPVPLPSCTFSPPPVYSGNWDEDAWDRWIAACCNCTMHAEWRKRTDIERKTDRVLANVAPDGINIKVE